MSPAGGFYVDRAQAMIETLDIQLDEIHGELCRIGRTQPGARAIGGLFGFGPLLSVLAWSEMGDTRRFSSSRQAVRFAARIRRKAAGLFAPAGACRVWRGALRAT